MVLVLAIAALGIGSMPMLAAPANPGTPTPRDDGAFREAGVNELGIIPVLMYHHFTNGIAEGPWERNLGDFRSDLEWLADHGFVTMGLRDLIDDTIEVPFGKKPVILTFDDALPEQFQFMQNDAGDLVPTPDSAVGVLEAVFAAHPDFGHTAHFAVTTNACFSIAGVEFNTYDDYCPKKLQWLNDHGYEVGNHTKTHPHLPEIAPESFVEEIGGAAAFIDERMHGEGNLSHVLTLPYGEAPEPGTENEQLLRGGFWYGDDAFQVEAMVRVSGGPTYAPQSTYFDPMTITRVNTDQASLDVLFEQCADPEFPLYVSDGDPDTVTIADPLPEYTQNEFDADHIANNGKDLVVYPSADLLEPGPLPKLQAGVEVVTAEEDVRLRDRPGVDSEVVAELPRLERLTIIGGPKKRDGYKWWKVETAQGDIGWIAQDFLGGLPED
jgi:peptidoglycan/xylan/chitin deacetylase (PgdA/CDA1 family)